MKLKRLSFAEILVHIVSLILFVFAGYYYLERTLPFDGAFYSFRISETGWFSVDNFRYGVQHTQILPLLFLKAGCSLKTFLISYSISFVLCNYILCILILYVYKQPKMALALVFATVISYTYKFFYPVSEIHSTTGPLFLFAAHVFHFSNRKNNILYFLLTALYITWFLFIHVISIIPAFFILTYYVSYSKSFVKSLPVLIFSGLILVIEFILIKIFFTSEYSAGKMIGMNEVITFLSNPNSASGFIYFKNEFLFNYLPLEIIYMGCIIFLVFKKEFLQVLIIFVFTLGTWLIIMAYNLKHDAPIVYMNYYGLFGIYIAFPFCLYVLTHISVKKFTLAYTLLILGSLIGIIRSGAFLSDQVNYFKRITSNMKTPKSIILPNNLNWDSLWLSWDLSFQSLLASSLEDPQQAKTFFSSEDTSLVKQYISSTELNCFFNTFFSPTWFPAPFANKNFYVLPPSKYTCLNTLQDSSFKDSILSNKTVEILASSEPVYLIKDNFRMIPVTVINHSKNLIPSVPTEVNQLSLSYHVLNSKQEMLFHDGKRSPLEKDIKPNSPLSTGLQIDCTQLRRGRVYYIDVDVVMENKRWLKINKRIKIILL
jgi:hypothetical protein